MSFDRADWFESQKAKGVAETRERTPELRQMARAAVAAEKLTGDESWDHFLTLLQDVIDRSVAREAMAMDTLRSPGVLDHSSLLAAKVDLIRMQERREVLEQVIALPRKLKEKGKEALDALAILEDA